MRRAAIVEITPKGRPAYFIVTVVGRGDLCRILSDAGEAILYQRTLNEGAIRL